MVTFRSIATALASISLLAPSSLGHSFQRGPLGHVSLIDDASIDTPSRRAHSHSQFHLTFTIRSGNQKIRLALHPNHDVVHDDFAVTHLAPDGTVREIERVPRTEHKVYKGDAFIERSGQRGWSKAGWARIMIHRDGAKPTFSGAFGVDGDHHHVQSAHRYLKLRGQDDPPVDVPGDAKEFMVVWRDSDLIDPAEVHDGRTELKRSLASDSLCGADSLDFNSHVDLSMQSPRPLQAMDLRSLFGRQIGDSRGGGNPALDLVSSIGSLDGCPSTRKVALVGIATDCVRKHLQDISGYPEPHRQRPAVSRVPGARDAVERRLQQPGQHHGPAQLLLGVAWPVQGLQRLLDPADQVSHRLGRRPGLARAALPRGRGGARGGQREGGVGQRGGRDGKRVANLCARERPHLWRLSRLHQGHVWDAGHVLSARGDDVRRRGQVHHEPDDVQGYQPLLPLQHRQHLLGAQAQHGQGRLPDGQQERQDHHGQPVRQRHRRDGRGLRLRRRAGVPRQQVLRRQDVQVHARLRLRPLQRGLLLARVQVRVERDRLPRQHGRVRPGRDVHGRPGQLPRGHAQGRRGLVRRRAQLRLGPVHVARPAVPGAVQRAAGPQQHQGVPGQQLHALVHVGRHGAGPVLHRQPELPRRHPLRRRRQVRQRAVQGRVDHQGYWQLDPGAQGHLRPRRGRRRRPRRHRHPHQRRRQRAEARAAPQAGQEDAELVGVRGARRRPAAEAAGSASAVAGRVLQRPARAARLLVSAAAAAAAGPAGDAAMGPSTQCAICVAGRARAANGVPFPLHSRLG